MRAKNWEEYKEEVQAVYDQKGWTVTGWHGEWKGWETKLTCECSVHGEWRSTNINGAKTGRGCPRCRLIAIGESRSISWEEHKEQIQTIYDQVGKPWKVIGWYGEWKGVYTKIVACCAKHGEWDSTNISNAKSGSGCKGCQVETIRQNKLVEDSIHIEEFNKACPDNVPRKYYRSDRLDSRGKAAYWIVECSVCSYDEYVKAGVCNGRFESLGGNLKRGQLVCRCAKFYRYTPGQWLFRMTKACQERGDQFVGFVGKVNNNSKFKYLCSEHGEQTIKPANYLSGIGCPGCAGQNQRELYINLISDESGSMYAAKLGISKDSDIRLSTQNRRNNHTMKRALLFLFDAVQDCKDTEQYLKHHVPSIGYVPDLHMKDGSTETFALDDLDYVVQTIKQRGGVLQEENYVS